MLQLLWNLDMCVCAKTDKMSLKYVVDESSYKRFELSEEYTQARQDSFPLKPLGVHREAVLGGNGLDQHLLKKTSC